MESILNSPFKFLDPYGRDDYNIFFGRDEEVNALYQHIHKNRLVLVYGTSGTGKTSIVQCGLQNRMDDTDWFPLFIRRGDQLVDSLLAVTEMAADTKAVEMPATSLTGSQQYKNAPQVLRARPASSDAPEKIYAALKGINLRYLRSVYLIFDQFEELLIMGSEEEKANTIRIIDHILTDPELQFCNFLFIMREEFFAGLSRFEKDIPDFCDRRLRIEPMNNRNVEEVIVRSCERFNIELEQGADNAREIIAVLSDRQTVSLPYLQIYLDQLWRTVYLNTPNKTEPGNSTWPHLRFNSTIIRRFGCLQDVLDRFMHERIHVIQEQLQTQFPDLPDNFVGNVLDAFVTSEGTKRPVPYARVNSGIWFTGQVPKYLQGRSSALMNTCLSELDKNKILRSDGQTYELAHDILAKLIDNRRTEDQRRAGFTERQINSRYDGFKNNASDHLSEREIISYGPYIKQLNLSPEVTAFYEASIKKQEEVKIQQAIEAERTDRLKRRQKRWKLGWIGFGILLLVTTALYFNQERLQREFNRNESLVYMGYDLADKDAATALGLFGIFRTKVYGEDTSMLNLKLKETMQLQAAQALFARWDYDLPYVKVEQIDVDISDDGQYIVYNVRPKERRDSVRNYILSTINGQIVEEFDSVQYACFADGGNILVLSRSSMLQEVTPPPTKMKKQPEKRQYRKFSQATLYDCDKRVHITMPLDPGEHLHGLADISQYANNSEESYNVRVLANGNILVPYQSDIQDLLMLLSPDGRLIRHIPSQSTITTSRDGRRFMNMYFDGGDYPALQIFNENGQLLHAIRDEITYADFTDEGSPIWGSTSFCHILHGNDTLTYDAPANASISYAYGNMATGKIALRVNTTDEVENSMIYREGVIIADINNGKQEFYPGIATGIDFVKGGLVTRLNNPNANGYDAKTDTLRRYDISGNQQPSQYLVPEGIDFVQYNRTTGNVLTFTRANQLFVLDDRLGVKKGLKLTSNDTYGMARSGKAFFYARDRYLTVFDNDSARLNVFDQASIWARISSPGSPVKPITDKKRIRELGLNFK